MTITVRVAAAVLRPRRSRAWREVVPQHATKAKRWTESGPLRDVTPVSLFASPLFIYPVQLMVPVGIDQENHYEAQTN